MREQQSNLFSAETTPLLLILSGDIELNPGPASNGSVVNSLTKPLAKLVGQAPTRDAQKIGPQLGISPISGHFWPKIGLGVENFQKLGSRLGLGLQN